ncbi:MAG: flagellar biosynthetic protein FliQ [Deltaproteobacteria bacterium]|nr:flagellar biosynthetic protein FliQ [Deltaproteobacteria bacterium]
MTIDQALALITELLKTTILVGGPVLAAALVGGVLIGIVQTATQINEASVAYVVKAGCVILMLLVTGTSLASRTVQYTRETFMRIADVVR